MSIGVLVGGVAKAAAALSDIAVECALVGWPPVGNEKMGINIWKQYGTYGNLFEKMWFKMGLWLTYKYFMVFYQQSCGDFMEFHGI